MNGYSTRAGGYVHQSCKTHPWLRRFCAPCFANVLAQARDPAELETL